ncbi:MAG: glycosyltransferase family 4 protein [Candidatus Hydrogenedentota bacterium]
MMRILADARSRLSNGIRNLLPEKKADLYFVAPGSGWAVDWVAHYLMKELAEKSIRARITTRPAAIANSLIHFLDRYQYLDGRWRTIPESNTIFMTWYHADADDPHPSVRKLYDELRSAAPRIDRIVTSCETSRQDLLRFGIPKTKIILIPIGIDLSVFRPPRSPQEKVDARRALGIPDDAVCIGSFQKDGVGWDEGLEPKLIKGPDIFLEAIKRLKPDHEKLFVLLSGPARGFVVKGLERMGIPYLHRNLSEYHDIVKFYHALDLYLIASRVEGGPKSLMESWACGVPLVSTRMGMPADLIHHGENALMADVDDVEGLVRHIKQFLESPALRERCTRQGRADVLPLDWPRLAERHYQEVYLPHLPARLPAGMRRKAV